MSSSGLPGRFDKLSAGVVVEPSACVDPCDRRALERLAALTPRPRVNLILYHGAEPRPDAERVPPNMSLAHRYTSAVVRVTFLVVLIPGVS